MGLGCVGRKLAKLGRRNKGEMTMEAEGVTVGEGKKGWEEKKALFVWEQGRTEQSIGTERVGEQHKSRR